MLELVADPQSSLLNYGVLGIAASLLIYVVKRLYDQQQKTYDLIIADKDRQIASKDAMIEQFMDVFGGNVVPTLARNVKVLEAQTGTPANTDRLESMLVDLAARLDKK